MARNDEEEISTLEEVAARAGYNVEVKSRQAGANRNSPINSIGLRTTFRE